MKIKTTQNTTNMKKILLISVALFTTLSMNAQVEKLIYEMDWAGVEYTEWNYFEEAPNESYYETTDEGLAITNPATNDHIWEVRVINRSSENQGLSLEDGHDYVVRLTLKVPSDGHIFMQLGNLASSWYDGASVTASDDWQVIDIKSPRHISGDAHVLLGFGEMVGTTILKKVQVYEVLYTSMAMQAQEYFPTGMKWEEVNVEPSMELEYENAHIYEIGTDTIIGNVTYKKVLKDNVFSGLCVRESGDKVWLLTKEYPTEILLYNFDWDGNKVVETEYLKGDEAIGFIGQNMEVYEVHQETTPVGDSQTVVIDGKTYQYYKDSFIRSQIRGIGKVAELNRYPCLLGYKEMAVISPGMTYFKVHWIQRNGEEIFRSDYAREWTTDIPDIPRSDYLPFVEQGKQWHVVSNPTNPYVPCSLERLEMTGEVERDGKTYVLTNRINDGQNTSEEVGLFREEGRRVYKYEGGRDVMMYDFSLKEGDTFTYEFETGFKENCKVLKLGWLDDGPNIMTSENKYRKLRTWTIGVANGSGGYKEAVTWIEGVGKQRNMFYRPDHGGVMSCLAYIEREGKDYFENGYLPFILYNMYGPVYGCNLPIGAENNEEDDRHHHLTYEMEGDRLHVYGDVFTQCGPNNYAYFYEKPTDDPLVHKIEFEIKEIEPLTDCMALHATDFYVPWVVNPTYNYIVVDNNGEEHPVVNKTYRPFVEDDKVWKVGHVNSGNPVQWVEYYYFDGDTIIGGKTCKQMMRQRYVGPDIPDYDYISQQPSLTYVGAWYEENQIVYTYDTRNNQFKMMYDFSVEANDTLQINDQSYVIGPRQMGGTKGFKGVYRDVMMCKEEGRTVWSTPWLEGVGGIYGMTTNVIDTELADPAWFLMSCTVGDEVIYFRDGVEDGATPAEARKQRFDFTHTIKIKPKSRSKQEESDACISSSERDAARQKVKSRSRQESDIESIYGEYNDVQLGIHLDPLDDAYLVHIADETGKVVYEKTINAGNIVALNIDISSYAKGQYNVIVENSSESFTGEFGVQTVGIEKVRSNKPEVRGYIYNLHGQRLNTLQKGLNIVNGRKVYVK